MKKMKLINDRRIFFNIILVIKLKNDFFIIIYNKYKNIIK